MIGGLFGMAIGNPAAGLAIGKALSDDGGNPLAPAPYVVLKVGGHDYQISPVARTYTPSWPQPIVVDARSVSPTDQAVIQIMDAIDGSLIGQRAISVTELFAQPTKTLTDIGPVASLDIALQPAPPRHSEDYDLVVPGEASLEALTQGRFPSWFAVPVWNGDTVEISATGSVCPSRHSDDCFDPDGVPGDRWRSYSYPDFRDTPHAALVSAVPGAKYLIGQHAKLTVEQSGQVLLFVNDSDADNNRGAFQVHVTVTPPQ